MAWKEELYGCQLTSADMSKRGEGRRGEERGGD